MTPETLASAWPQILALVALGAWLALDDTAYWQTWLSQPLPASILAGLVGGDVGTGLAVGLPVQVLAIGHLPIGQSAAGERTTPVVAVVGAACLCGFHLPALPFGSAGPAAVQGWLLVAVAVIAALGYRLIRFERRLHMRWMVTGLRRVRGDRLDSIDVAQRRCLAATLIRGAVGTLFWLMVICWLWLPLLDSLPAWMGSWLAVLPLLAIPLGACALVDIYGTRTGMRWMLGGFAAAVVTGWWLI